MAGVLAFVTMGATVGLALAGSTGAAAASSAVPYTDHSVVGSIGLCNRAGHQVTSGSIDAKPFAWRAVSTQPASAPYNNKWRTATLYAFQPQQGLTADEWSGRPLTASSRYTNPANPMTAATNGDESLKDFTEEFRPKWDGFLQLRIYLDTQNQAAYSLHYPALDIQVTGNTWHAVGGSTVNCSSGTAESLETIVQPADTAEPGTSPSSSPKGH